MGPSVSGTATACERSGRKCKLGCRQSSRSRRSGRPRRCQGAQDRPESRHAGHSMDARRRRYGVAGVHRVYPNCEIRWTK